MRTLYKFFLMFIFIIIQAFFVMNVSANSDEHYMYTIERLVQEERYHVAEQLMKQHQTSIIQQAGEEKDTYAPILEEYLLNSLNMLADPNATHAEKQLVVQQTVILWDAMTTKTAPLWTTWKTELERKMEGMLGKSEISQAEMDELIYYVEVISPVVKLHLTSEKYKQYEESIQVITNTHPTNDQAELEETFSQIAKLSIDSMTNANAHYTKWLIGIVFTFIFLSLSYVAWAKYRAEYSRS
ncbi:sporulation protein YpjB [Gracilibacillus sp. S3-1-1]|uniref:Sporulation protein YpjB n=1 Tax=Gracilibacillus pellucidus TaxID=3095368 RepID=A0ACC6M5A2_9BACI|nr:sporulation protein YpjB [Gracilibacillus sp. S3-1-1]MDX8046134.1 sporulation protein YpjB [Gracilibacillus sp. S3-1-1]